MNGQRYQSDIEQMYHVVGERLFARDPETCVFRHCSNRKWFAVIMQIPRAKLGLCGDGHIRILNVKCDPRLIGSFRQEAGIFPAYHMNKAHWLTVALDGTVEDETIRFLLDMSYNLTKSGRIGL